MKLKLILCLALVLSGLFGSRVAAQNVSETNKWHGFPTFPPITNANPSITHQISVRVPTKLKIERTTDMLSVTIDANTNSFESTNLMVGTNMVTGVRTEDYVYPVGETRSAKYGGRGSLSTDLDFNIGTIFLHTKRDGIPQAGKSYIVEMDLAVFETDIPGGHLWMPESEKYKVIWRRTLKQIVK
jgi:hypothetical protein